MSDHSPGAGARRFRRGDVEVEISESADGVTLALNGHPVDVEIVDGKYHSQFAHATRAFDSVDEIVDVLMANEGRTWRLAHPHHPTPHRHEGGGS